MQKVHFYLKNQTKGSIIANYTEFFDVVNDGSMHVRQVYCLGNQFSGVQFTAQLHSNGSYQALVFGRSGLIEKSEIKTNGFCKIDYFHSDGDHYLYFIGVEPKHSNFKMRIYLLLKFFKIVS
ncbi:MAG: hypothetical protein U1F46_17555 [Marinagarivorans sp.]